MAQIWFLPLRPVEYADTELESTYEVIVAGSGTAAVAGTRRQDDLVLVEGRGVRWRAMVAAEARHHGTIGVE